jgi:MSHA biogenesis protein MshJ
MNAVKQQWVKINERYLALTRRERLIVSAALIFAPLMLGDALVLDPLRARVKQAQGGLTQQSSALAEMQAQVISMQQQVQNDPDAGAKAELAALVVERQKLDEALRQLGTTLVRPEEMNALLKGMLMSNAGLRLISLKTIAPRSILGQKVVNQAVGEPGAKVIERKFDLYKHEVEVRVEGSFSELQAYLVQLEQVNRGLLWSGVQYKVLEHPRAEMSVIVYTLSSDRAWLVL